MANWKASDIAKVFGANERVDLAEAERIADYGAVPGIVESGNFAFWNKADHDEPEQGMHTQRCSWSARLARYMGEQLLPEHRNFVVVNGARGGVDIWSHLMTAHENFEERRGLFPPNSTWSRLALPLSSDVDLVLVETTGNDYQVPESEGGFLAPTEAFLRYLLTSLHGRRVAPGMPAASAGAPQTKKEPPPTVALVDVPCENTYGAGAGGPIWGGIPHFHKIRRELAEEYAVPVVDSVLDSSLLLGELRENQYRGRKVGLSGAADSETEHRERVAFLEGALSRHKPRSPPGGSPQGEAQGEETPFNLRMLQQPFALGGGFAHYHGTSI